MTPSAFRRSVSAEIAGTLREIDKNPYTQPRSPHMLIPLDLTTYLAACSAERAALRVAQGFMSGGRFVAWQLARKEKARALGQIADWVEAQARAALKDEAAEECAVQR